MIYGSGAPAVFLAETGPAQGAVQELLEPEDGPLYEFCPVRRGR